MYRRYDTCANTAADGVQVETAVGTMLAVVAEYNTPQELGAAGSAAPLPLEVARCVMLCQVGGHGGCGPLHA
jgi:hypothetical protein